MRMRLLLFYVLVATITMASTLFAQEEKTSSPPESRMETRQGYSGQSDVVAHRFVSKGTLFRCIQVEHHPKDRDDHAACQLRFKDGSEYTLAFNDTTHAEVDGEVSLKCLGDKPTKCVIGMWSVKSLTKK